MTTMVLTAGEALAAFIPTEPGSLERARQFEIFTGGAELNFAVGLARLGVAVEWLGLLGDDPPGAWNRAELVAEGVGTTHVRRVASGRTAFYMREWASSDDRRAIYFRAGAVGEQLDHELWPQRWVAKPAWIHLTGVTAALGPKPRRLLETALTWAEENQVPVSFDPNYRPELWDPQQAAAHFRAIAKRARVTFLSEADAIVLTGTNEPAEVFDRLHAAGVSTAILRRGERDIVACQESRLISVPVSKARSVRDTVGAGDGFNAGFVAGQVRGARFETSLELGSFIGGAAVEQVGDHPYPRLSAVPPTLRMALKG